MSTIVIIGNGVAGISAALGIRARSSDAIVVISDESEYFFSRTALMYVYMGHMRLHHLRPYEDSFWREQEITLRHDYAERVDTAGQTVHLRSGAVQPYDVLLLATGSCSNDPALPGGTARGIQSLYSLGDLERMEEHTRGIRHAVVIGGGLIGVEAAEMLLSRSIGVTHLVRDAHYWASVLPREEAALVERHIRAHGVDLRLRTQVSRFTAGTNGRVQAVETTDGESIACNFVLTAVGVHPNTSLARASGIPCARGILVDEYFRTSLPDVYAIGDCAEIVRDDGTSRIEPLWYAARAHGTTVAQTIAGTPRRYTPGVFFNSAKFFEIEYQTYGTVQAQPAPGEQTLYWEHPDGTRCIRIASTSAGVTGFNALGVRLSQEVCCRWIEERRSIDEVVQHIDDALFDPEFSPRYGRELRQLYNRVRRA